MSVYAVVLLMLAFAAGVRGNAVGANSGACTASSMTPQHSGSSQSLNTSPYSISLSASEYNHGSSVVVTLQGTPAFKGFLLLALPADDSTASAIGSFSVTQSGDGTVISQDRCTGGTTHTSSFGSLNTTSIELTWTAPSSGATNITFYATFVQAYAKFYVKQPSSVLTFVDPTTTTLLLQYLPNQLVLNDLLHQLLLNYLAHELAVNHLPHQLVVNHLLHQLVVLVLLVSTSATSTTSTMAASLSTMTNSGTSTKGDAEATISAATAQQSALVLVVPSTLICLMLKSW